MLLLIKGDLEVQKLVLAVLRRQNEGQRCNVESRETSSPCGFITFIIIIESCDQITLDANTVRILKMVENQRI